MATFRINLIARYFLLFSTVVMFVSSRQVRAESTWAINKGDSSVDMSNNTIHIAQDTGTHTTHYALVAQSLNLPPNKPWKINFDFKFGQLRSAGCGVTISHGTDQICWVGGDQWYKSMVAGLDQTLIYQQPTDGEWHNFSFSSDCKTISIVLDGRVVGSAAETAIPNTIKLGSFIDKQAIPGEQTEIWVRNVQINGENVSSVSPSVTAAHTTPLISARPPVITLHDDEPTICCLPGDTLRLTGHYDSPDKLQTAFLDTGSGWMFKREAKGKSDDFSYDWQAPKAGVYTLVAAYLNDANVRVDVRHLQVNVLPADPFSVALPKSAISDVTVAATPLPQVPFHPDNVTFYLNGNKVETIEGQHFTVKLPISDLSAGVYPFFYEARDEQHGRFIGSTSTITVPERVQVVFTPTVQIATPNDKVPLNVNLAPGVTVAKVVYSFGGQQIGVSDHAPYTASVSLTSFKSGKYDVQAIATDANGRTIASPAYSVALTNQPDDAARALDAKIAAEQKVKEEQKQAQIAQQQAEQQARLAKEEAERPAREAAAKRAELQRILNIPPKVPPGEGPRKCALALRDYLATAERDKNAEDRAKLDEITDIRSSDSKIYPYDVYAIIKFPDYDSMEILTMKEIFAVNPETNQVSDYTRKWGD